jgi:hypothetical protein
VAAPVVGVTAESELEIRQRGVTLGCWDLAELQAAHTGGLTKYVD